MYIYIYIYILGTTCLKLLVERRRYSKVANSLAKCGDPWHYNQRIKQTRPYWTSSVKLMVPPKRREGQREGPATPVWVCLCAWFCAWHCVLRDALRETWQDLQEKFQHFEQADEKKFREVWAYSSRNIWYVYTYVGVNICVYIYIYIYICVRERERERERERDSYYYTLYSRSGRWTSRRCAAWSPRCSRPWGARLLYSSIVCC